MLAYQKHRQYTMKVSLCHIVMEMGMDRDCGNRTRDKTMVRRLSAQYISQMQIYATKTER